MLQPRETSDDGSSLGDGQESGGTGLDAEALKVLDGQKLPVNDRVSDWLNGSPAPNQSGVFSTVFTDKEVNLLEHLGRMQLLHNLLHPNYSENMINPVSSSTSIEPNLLSAAIPTAFASDPMEFQVENLKTAYLAAKTSGVAAGSSSDSHLHNAQGHDCIVERAEGAILENRLMPTMATEPSQSLKEPASERVKATVCCDTKCSKMDSPSVDNTAAQELQKERARREKLERELVEEKQKRMKLEQEVALAQEIEHQEQMSQMQSGGISQSQKVSSDRGQAGFAGTDGMECSRKSGSFVALTSESTKGACTSQVVRLPADTSSKVATNRHQNLSSCNTEPKTAKTPSSSKPNTRYADSSNILQTPSLPRPQSRAPLPERCATPSNRGAKITRERETKIVTPHPRPFLSKTPINPSTLTSSRDVGTCTKPSSIAIPSCTPQTTASCVNVPQCNHQCLGCHPRFKCPLITSRNFVKMLRADHFTCAYHRRLVTRLANQLDNLPHTVIRSNQIGQQAGTSSNTHRTLHTDHKSVSTQTRLHSTITIPPYPGLHSQRSSYQESPLRMECSPPLSAPQVNLAASFPTVNSLTPKKLQEESTYSHHTQHLPQHAISPEMNHNLPPPKLKHHPYGSTSRQPTCQHIKPLSGNQHSKISSLTHHRQPKTKAQCSSSHSKKLTKSHFARSPPLANVTNVTHRPLSVFDYHSTAPDKFKAANTNMPAMLPPSNHREVSN